MWRALFVVMLILFAVVLIVPSVVAKFLPHENAGLEPTEPQQTVDLQVQDKPSETINISIDVYRSVTKAVEKVPLEEYVRGVVASEMPHDFEVEALKAQALAARTYIVRRLIEQDFSDTPDGSVVTDTVNHQVYQSEEELRNRWGPDYENNISRINEAVNETIGQILTFEGKPIDATFFSTSNGRTENSEDYWGQEIPYLRSVESPWDANSPRYEEVVAVDLASFEERLGTEVAAPAGAGGGTEVGTIISRTETGRVHEVEVGDKIFTGKEIRELLDLASTDFEWELRDGNIIIHMNGYGHGVGMSQYGANGMAREGHTAEEIVKYFYQDIDIQDYRQWIVRK